MQYLCQLGFTTLSDSSKSIVTLWWFMIISLRAQWLPSYSGGQFGSILTIPLLKLAYSWWQKSCTSWAMYNLGIIRRKACWGQNQSSCNVLLEKLKEFHSESRIVWVGVIWLGFVMLVILYGSYHGKSPSRRTIWENMFGTFFQASKNRKSKL